MKIGIIGSHGVGKSTLARHLSETLHLPLIEEQMRKSACTFSDINLHSLEEIINSYWYPHYVFDLVKRQIEDEESCDEWFVSDRTVLDYYLYYQALSRDSLGIKKILQPYIYDYFIVAYDVIIYLPIKFPLVSDGFRNEDSEFQISMDVMLKKEAEHLRDVYTLKATKINSRIKEALNILHK